jgi:exodeoxyribonuclease V beta subunit
MADVARLLADHTPPGSRLGGYGSRLQSAEFVGHLRGYLTGSLDLVMRVTDGGLSPRFVVVDYKTNWLAPDGEALNAWHYRRAALDAEMQRSHYPLQAVLYLVALHRYLRWRLPDYDPAIHLGGVIYAFLRGMLGPHTPIIGGEPIGVFAWQPPAALVTGLSELLDSPGEKS